MVKHADDSVQRWLSLDFCDIKTFAETAAGRNSVEEVIHGLGDAAYAGPKGPDEPNTVAFRSGNRAVRLRSSAVTTDGARAVSYEQLREIADMIASRMD